jgi:parallel beta-helix repeat protein
MRRLFSQILIVLLLLGVLASAFSIRSARADTIIVPDDYATIQLAINAASSGDTIFVRAGIYSENVVVNKTVSLNGENMENTIIDGGNLDNTVSVTASDAVISGFTVTNSGSPYPTSGIFLDNVQNSVVAGNNVSGNNGFGIFVMWGSNNSLLANIVTYNTQPGIRIDGTTANAFVANNTIEYNKQDGIFVYYAYNVDIEDNIIANNMKSGISPQGDSFNVTIRHNVIADNGMATTLWDGIFVYYSNNTRIIDNDFSSNKRLGVYLYGANSTLVSGNTFTHDGMVVRDSYKNTVTNNSVNGKPLVYLEDALAGTIGTAGQVILINCSNIQVKNLNLSDADVGLELFLAKNSIVTGNNMSNGYVGIRLYNSSNNIINGNSITMNSNHGVYTSFSCTNNTLSGNSITTNAAFGIQWGYDGNNNVISGNDITMNTQNGLNIHTFSSSNVVSGNNITMNGGTGFSVGTLSNNNVISGNNISGNGLDGITLYNSSSTIVSGNNLKENNYGIELQSANFSKIFHNDFIDNIISQASVDANSYGNTWDNGYPSGGNYWSDYSGTDSNGDDIGDTPYIIDASNADNYPFMNQSGWKNTMVSFSATPNPAYVGQTVAVLGELTDYAAQPISNARVDIYVNGAFSGNLVTNASGWFKAAAPVNTAGTYNITIVYGGSESHNPSSHTEILLVNAKVDTKVTFSLSPSPAKVGQTVTLKGNLTDIYGNPIGNTPLELYVKVGSGSWQFMGNLSTNSSGWFQGAGKVTSTGTYQVAVLYRGSYKYNQSYHIETLIVNPAES